MTKAERWVVFAQLGSGDLMPVQVMGEFANEREAHEDCERRNDRAIAEGNSITFEVMGADEFSTRKRINE
ncbi:MAG: hypothetical protein K0U74_12075 [Alphaproteobacteria bacterium]|nr:hypothetical protein [Alphaproteobacteria bacterium]